MLQTTCRVVSGRVESSKLMAKAEDPVVKAQVTLTGAPAKKVLTIAAREGNPLSSVLRRLVSVGLRHEPEEGAT